MARYKKQKDGRYRLKITIGTDAGGAPVCKYASARTIRELEAAAERLRLEYRDGFEKKNLDVLFEPFAAAWFTSFKEPHITPGTARNYKSVLNKHLYPALGKRRMRAITPNDLQALLNSLHRSPCACEAAHLYLKQIFSAAHMQRIIDDNPALYIKKTQRNASSRRALTDGETQSTLRVIDTHPDGLLLALLYYLGLRRGEALGLQWKHINFTDNTVYVEQDIDFSARGAVGAPKTPAAVRRIPMPAALRDRLRVKRGLPNVFLLQGKRSGAALSESSYKRKWAGLMQAMVAAADAIGEETGKRIKIEQTDGASILTPHYYRHNYATMLYDAGVDVLTAKTWIGHSDIKTTMAIYTHLSKAKEKQSAQKIDAVFSR